MLNKLLLLIILALNVSILVFLYVKNPEVVTGSFGGEDEAADLSGNPTDVATLSGATSAEAPLAGAVPATVEDGKLEEQKGGDDASRLGAADRSPEKDVAVENKAAETKLDEKKESPLYESRQYGMLTSAPE